jgi:hypothetical protein
MTLKEIKLMFVKGQRWRVTREGGKPLVIQGNLGTTTLSANNGATERVVERVKSGEVVWLMPNGKSCAMAWPKAANVQEAHDGYLRFNYPEMTYMVITCERL